MNKYIIQFISGGELVYVGGSDGRGFKVVSSVEDARVFYRKEDAEEFADYPYSKDDYIIKKLEHKINDETEDEFPIEDIAKIVYRLIGDVDVKNSTYMLEDIRNVNKLFNLINVLKNKAFGEYEKMIEDNKEILMKDRNPIVEIINSEIEELKETRSKFTSENE